MKAIMASVAVELRHREIRRRLPQDLVRLPQLADLALQRPDALAILGRRARPLAPVALGPPHPLPQRLGRAPDFGRDRADRGPLRGVVAPWSSTIRTARCRTSGENRFDVFFVIAPSSQRLGPPANPGRFKHRPGGATVAHIAEATGWAAHTVRGFFAGLKKRGIEVAVLERVRQLGPDKAGAKGSYTVYRVAAAG